MGYYKQDKVVYYMKFTKFVAPKTPGGEFIIEGHDENGNFVMVGREVKKDRVKLAKQYTEGDVIYYDGERKQTELDNILEGFWG
jgi:hypothetical protein